MALSFKGRVWKFGDDINTDLMVPAIAMTKPAEERLKYCFSANRPGWVDMVKEGDIIVGGKNFGLGSSRPGAEVLRDLDYPIEKVTVNKVYRLTLSVSSAEEANRVADEISRRVLANPTKDSYSIKIEEMR